MTKTNSVVSSLIGLNRAGEVYKNFNDLPENQFIKG